MLVHPGDGRQPLERAGRGRSPGSPRGPPRTAASSAPRRRRRHPTDRRRAAPASTSPRRTGPRRSTARRPPRAGRRSGSSSARSGRVGRSRAGRARAGPGTPRRRPSARTRPARDSAHHQARGSAAVRGTGFRRVVHGAMIWGPSEGAAMKRGWRQRGRTGPRDCIGRLDAGRNDAITDVRGVRVGHTTLIDGDGPLVVGQGPSAPGSR